MISGNVIKNCAGPAIANSVPIHDIVIVGNVVENADSSGVAAAVRLTDATQILNHGKPN